MKRLSGRIEGWVFKGRLRPGIVRGEGKECTDFLDRRYSPRVSAGLPRQADNQMVAWIVPSVETLDEYEAQEAQGRGQGGYRCRERDRIRGNFGRISGRLFIGASALGRRVDTASVGSETKR